MKKILIILICLPIFVFSQTKYEVISEKAYFFSPKKLIKQKAYLIKEDIVLCNEDLVNNTPIGEEKYFDEYWYCFCLFKHHTGRITTGYLSKWELRFVDEQYIKLQKDDKLVQYYNNQEWYSLTNIEETRDKTYFYRPSLMDRNKSYLIEGDLVICDDDTIEIQDREYCYCEF